MAKNPMVVQLLASAARTATPSPVPSQGSEGYNGIRVIVDVTSVTSTPSVVMTLEGLDPVINKWYTVLAGTAITDVTGTGTYIFKVFPSATPSPGAVANDVLPGTWRVNMVHGNANSITYSVDVELLYG